ncbi:MAG: HDOD domain-containing protein [Dechloromonas sp.]|nr:MAG: HDOD domain-containing protein [Dechloromonas sp.]
MFNSLKKLFGGPSKTLPASQPQGSPSTPAAPAPASGTTPDSLSFLCREAVFDRSGRLAGRLFMVRGSGLQAVAEAPLQRRADDALLTALACSPAAWSSSLAFLPLSSASLDLPVLETISSQNLVLLIHLAATPSDPGALCGRIAELRQRGTGIGIFRQPGHPAFTEVIHLADYGALDVSIVEPATIRDFSAAFRAAERDHKASLFAGHIETLDEHRLCHQWHFDYFHGAFATSTPPRDDDAATDPHKVQLLHMLRLVQGDAETGEIVAAMKQDPPLAFRILRYLNSPLIGLDHRIESLSQALTILGRQRLTRWLSVLLFSVRTPSFGDWLLVECALTRGRLMETLGARLLPGEPPDALFLTGVFSCLDKLLRRPLAELLDEIPLSIEVRDALIERNGPYAPLLALAEASEAFDFERMEKAAQAMAVPADVVNRALLAATAWASEVSEYWE